MKADLRKSFLLARARLSDAEIKKISKDITKKVLKLEEYKSAKTIHCYLSLKKEVSTSLIIDNLLKKDKNLVVPRVVAGTNQMEHVALETHEHMAINEWGISEPQNGSHVSPDQLDLVIVPMVGGDPHCNRLGYGKGFYDQFLSGLKCSKVGLMPECCLVDNLPVEPHDVKLDMVVTEKNIYTLERNYR